MDENKNQHLKKVQGTEHRLSIRGPGRPRGFCPSSFFLGGGVAYAFFQIFSGLQKFK